MTKYYDMDGKRTTLFNLCKSEPRWAESKINQQQAQINELRQKIKELKIESTK